MLMFLTGLLAGWLLRAWLAARRVRKDLAVLEYLLDHPRAYGLEMIEAGLGGRGTIYHRLRRLEDVGLLSSWEEPGGVERGYLPRRIYALTYGGRCALQVGRALA